MISALPFKTDIEVDFANVRSGPWLCQNAFPERAHFGEAAMRAISGFD
jgi:hypothetical protein